MFCLPTSNLFTDKALPALRLTGNSSKFSGTYYLSMIIPPYFKKETRRKRQSPLPADYDTHAPDYEANGTPAPNYETYGAPAPPPDYETYYDYDHIYGPQLPPSPGVYFY